jgi:hypothetical protein
VNVFRFGAELVTTKVSMMAPAASQFIDVGGQVDVLDYMWEANP